MICPLHGRPPHSFIHNQMNYGHQANMDITHKLMTCEIWRWLECVQECQSGKWSCFRCVGCSCEGVDCSQWLPLQCKLCMNIDNVYLCKNDYFYIHVKMACVLSLFKFNVSILSNYWGIICISVVRNLGQFTCFECNVASLLWFAYLEWKFVEVLNSWVVPI